MLPASPAVLARAKRRLLLLVVAITLALLAPPIAPSPAGAQPDLVAYEKVDQWPQRDAAAEGLFQSPTDLDVARDGRVYIADPGIGGLHTLLPSGTFTTPFGVTGGFPAQLGQVGPIAVGPDPSAFGAERLYVLDVALERVVVYGLDGQYVTHWDDVVAQGIAASADGRVYVLDRETSEVRALDAATGETRFAFGTRGTDEGQFVNFTDVDVSPDGRVLAVGDKRGQRVQLFDLATDAELAADPDLTPARHRRTYDLRQARYNRNDGTSCDASRVNALGDDRVFAGEADGACIIDPRTAAFAIASSANSRTVCRATVTMPRLRPTLQQYFALATYDPNAGPCGDKRTDLDTRPVVVQYGDEELRQVRTVFEASSNDNADNPLLFSPQSISLADPRTLFVADSSSQLRFFTLDGEQTATAARDTVAGNFSAGFEAIFLQETTGSDVLGEVFGYYVSIRRSQGDFNVEAGIGRFRTVEERGPTGIEQVIEPMWTDVLASSFQEIEVSSLAYNFATDELLVIRSDTIAQQRTQDTRIVRYTPDGRSAGEPLDLPDDGETNPYADLSVGPNGRVIALDDINDMARVFEPDGTPAFEVPVAFDTRAVASGPPSPEGSVFALREPGIVERFAADGRVTARFDARALDFADPTTLTDLVVDGQGRIYVTDGQSSLVTVFATTEDADAIPIPGDKECTIVGRSALEPSAVRAGEPAELTLRLDGRCGVGEDPADIVLVVPYYPRLEQGVDPASATINELLQVMARVDFGKHRAGLVSYYNTTTVELPLTGDRAAYIDAVRDVTRFTPASENIKPRLRDAMREAADLYDDPDRRRVMVLLRPEYCNAEFERFPGQCQGVPSAEETALEIRQSGVQIIAAYNPAAFSLASSDEDALFDLTNIHRRMVRYRLPDMLGTGAEVEHEVAPPIRVDPGSISGGGTWRDPVVGWSLEVVELAGASVTVELTADEDGTWPVASRIEAELTDGWGNAKQVTFPVPELEVRVPTPTPLPATATPPPTATPSTYRAYLPLLRLERCKDVPLPVELALVVDISSSMGWPATDGDRPKLAHAKTLAAAAVEGLDTEDRVAVVAYDREAQLRLALSADHGAARSAVERLATGYGSAIDRGLQAGTAALADARPEARRVMVLLSDGIRTVNGPADVRAAASAARSAGIEVHAFGVGDDLERETLIAIAGDAGRYLERGTAAEATALARAWSAGVRRVCE